MSTEQPSDYVPVDMLTLLHQLVKSQSDVPDRKSLPSALTSEHVAQLENLRREYDALFAGHLDWFQTEHSSGFIARQNDDGDAFARMHAGQSAAAEKEAPIQDLIAAMREVNHRLVQFDHNKALLTGATPTVQGLLPETTARVTATQTSFLDMFQKMREGYNWAAATTAPTGRDFVDKAVRSLIFGSSTRICNIDEEYAMCSTSFARRAVRSHENQRESIENKVTVLATRSPLDVRRATADKLCEDVKRVMSVTLDAAAGSRNGSDSQTELLTRMVETCADIVHYDLTTEHGPDEVARFCRSSSMSMLSRSLQRFFEAFNEDLQATARNLIRHSESAPATELDAEALRSIVDKFDACQPLTRAELRTQRWHQALTDMMQGLQTVTELKLTALHEHNDKGDKEEEHALLGLRSALEEKIRKHASLVGTIPPNEWYGGEKEPFQADPGDDSDIDFPDDSSAHSEESS